jgi:hypothetical protein
MKYMILYLSGVLAFITTVLFGEILSEVTLTLPINKDENSFLYYFTIIITSLVFVSMFIVYYIIINYYFI